MEREEQRTGPNLGGWAIRLSRQRRWVMASVFLGWGLVVCVAWVLPAKYRSETLILVEQQKVPEHYVEPNVAVDLQQRLRSMSEQILSRTRLAGIIDKFHLYGKDGGHSDIQALIERMRKDIDIDLVKASPVDQISAFKVSYSAPNPVVAQQVTAELTSFFIEENLRSRQQLSEDTTSFLENQLDSSRKNLEIQELRLREFKSKYLGQLPEQMGSNVQILAGLQNRLQTASDAANQGEQQRLYLQSLLMQYRSMRARGEPESKDGRLPATYELDQKISKLKSQLEEMKSKYTPRHPDVLRLQQELAATEKLKEQVDSQPSEQRGASQGDATVMSSSADLQSVTPLLQVQSQLKATEFDIANRKAEIKRIETEIDSYQARLNLAPAREQELSAITRDHEQSRAYYESLLAKRNQSEMATNLEKRQQGEQFRMIDPPSLPQRPFFPNRLIFSLGGLVFGLALGVGTVVAREVTNPTLVGEDELAQVIASPIVIVVPRVWTPAELRSQLHRRIFDICAATALMLFIPAVTLVLYYKA